MKPRTQDQKKPNTKSWVEEVTAPLFRQVDGASLGIFRIGFGLCMLVFFLDLLSGMKLDYLFNSPSYHFRYPGFEWVPLLSMPLLKILIGIATLASFLLVLGLHYRFATVTLAITYTWFFLQDQTFYLNHYYLMLILSWLLIVLPTNRRYLLFRRNDQELSSNPRVPVWSVYLLRFQVGIPYFFGGVAKLQSDWLNGHPMRIFQTNQPWTVWLGQWIDTELIFAFFTWGGLFFDLLIVPALLYSRTRPIAFLLVLFFHLMNAYQFPIGVFPWMMIIATTVFFRPDWPVVAIETAKNSLRRIKGRTDTVTSRQPEQQTSLDKLTTTATQTSGTKKLAGLFVFACFMAFQISVPLRCWFDSADPSWVERGHKYSWHMMLRHKVGIAKFFAPNQTDGQLERIGLSDYINSAQYRYIKTKPYLLRELATHISEKRRDTTGQDVKIYVLAVASLNGREPEFLIDPTKPINRQSQNVSDDSWILDYTNQPLNPPYSNEIDAWEANSVLVVGPRTQHQRGDVLTRS
jgi:vitamin K-dependent gamma-carboxylase